MDTKANRLAKLANEADKESVIISCCMDSIRRYVQGLNKSETTVEIAGLSRLLSAESYRLEAAAARLGKIETCVQRISEEAE
jgi:hypothetical protein